ncbi:putative integrase/recombinase y4rA [Novosphingobium endophyticum]|uniref:Integrase/recombinase y4rA n=1 Tax=Novosphingobium endophyticum TaxID=1955250 RepID=A0A916TWT5_9SPHN|nr:site-specific integrase [Novosphingobium endophyticum]GGC14318.1 putative integrase/recombinase y4rA [Novosphingobium endophyticum]
MITDDYLNTSRVVRGLKQGPFGEHIHLYIEWLQRRGYSREIGHRYLSLARDFGVWLAATGSGLTDIKEALVTRYLAERARHRPRYQGDALALSRLFSVLREANVIAPRPASPRDPREDLLQAYSLYMERARGLAPVSIVWFLRPFLQELRIATNADAASLSARDVSRYAERHAGDGGATTARIMCSRLRVFLRYLHCEGFIADDLTGAIPSIRRTGNERLPSFMPVEEVERVLSGCDRSTATGRRDYAILMLLARLGLRACEVARLSLDDFDWRAGEFTVRGKGRKTATMPLPPDVGAAITSYLQQGRPQSNSRRLFLLAVAPYTGFKGAGGVQTVARSAIRRAGVTGLARRGSHAFRHSLATGLLRSGATLTEISQLLRHEQHDTTRIYAKVDLDSLRPLGLPWLGGGQ